MTYRNQSFQVNLKKWLKKGSYFKERELEALVTIMSMLIGCTSFSLAQVAKRSPQRFGRNFLAKCLMKYAYVQREIMHQAFTDMAHMLQKATKILIIFDDTHVKKSGKKILGSYKWFDHTIRRQVQGFCIVNVAVVIGDQLIFIIPWVLRKKAKTSKYRSSAKKEQDAKTLAAIEMIQTLLDWFAEIGVPEKRLVIEADAWYGNRTVVAFIKQTACNFRIDGRKNYSVQIPDHTAIKSRKQKKRGRKRTRFVTYIPLEKYMGNPSKWDFFTDSEKQERVYYKISTVTLKTAGRVTVYAFKRENKSSTKFIMTRAIRKSCSTPQTVYYDYKLRWRIEEAHRDLKQQFGLGKCQARDAWVVHGFIFLVYLSYSLWKHSSFMESLTMGLVLKCPSWADQFHHEQIHHELLASA